MAIILMMLASASFATMSALVKAVGSAVPIPVLIFYRCLVPLPFFLCFLLLRRKKIVAHARGVMFLRAVFGFLAMACFYFALTRMPLADCIFIGRAQPLLLALFSPLLVGEKADKRVWTAILIGLTGVFIIVNPTGNISQAGWVALLGAGLAAIAHLLVRRLSRTDDPDVSVFNFFLLTSLFSGVWTLSTASPLSPPLEHLYFVAGLAFFATLGQFLMTWAYRLDRAPVVAAASYSSIVLSLIYGYLFWEEIPAASSWLGAFVIVTGIVYLFRGEKSK